MEKTKINVNAEEMERVAKFFLGLPEKAKIDMGVAESTVSVKNCGSPACVGGWLAVYYDTKFYTKSKTKFIANSGRNFADGANAFAKALGFKSLSTAVPYKDKLIEWVMSNPRTWGNGSGGRMFDRVHAFSEGRRKCKQNSVSEEGNLTVQDVGNKFLAVSKRIRKYEGVKYA